MAKKIIRPLHSEADYDVALNEIERYFENEPKPGTPEADRFDLLAFGHRGLRAQALANRTARYDRRDSLPDGDGWLYASRSWPAARLAPARIRYPDEEAPPNDEDGLAAAPRVGHSSGSIDRTATIARKKVGRIGVSAGAEIGTNWRQ